MTGQPVVFTGHVDPNHAGERVVLQQETASRGLAQPEERPPRRASNYSITHRWRFPGDHTVRVLFPSDVRNIRGPRTRSRWPSSRSRCRASRSRRLIS